MEAKREQALVGLFVLVVTAVLLVTLFALGGAFGRSETTYRTYFKFAGGLEPGSEVRYAGGPKIGRVQEVRIDPHDPARIEITLTADRGIPVKTDSMAKILSLSPLGENHLEITPGGAQAPRAREGTVLPSEPYVSFNDVTAQLNALGPEARLLVQTLTERARDLQDILARVNDMLSPQNRANVEGMLGHARGMLEENRPKLRSAISNVDAASAKVGPLLDDFRKTAHQADRALARVDELVGENRPDIRQAVADLRRTLTSTASLSGQLDRTMLVNSENIDELLENIRHITENLKQFTETIKARPFTLIRASGPKERKPGEPTQP